MRGGGECDLLGAKGLHGVESLAAALEQDANEIDDDVGIANRSLDRGAVAHIGLYGVDLADPAKRLQMAGEVGPPHRDADAVVAPGQRPDQMASQEPGAAENRDERVVGALKGHDFWPGFLRLSPGGWIGITGRDWGCTGRLFMAPCRGIWAGPTAFIDKGKPAPLSVARVPNAPARVAELVDALVSGTSAARRRGSSPFPGTT